MSGSSGTGGKTNRESGIPDIRDSGQHVESREMGLLQRYVKWLHTRWPAGTVEKLPDAREDGTTAVPGVRIVGDLTGIPLLKFSSDTGARAVQAILREPEFAGAGGSGSGLDLAI